MDRTTGRARFLGRAAALGAATFATLLATGTVGAQAATLTDSAAAPAQFTAQGVRETFTVPAGVDTVKVGAGLTHLTVTRSPGVSPYDPIPCTLSVTNPTYNGSRVQATATIRCAYPTSLYLQVGVSYNGNTPVSAGQSFPATYVDSVTVTTTATPGYYQADAIAVLSNGQQFGTYYSSNVYIPQ